MFEDEKEVKERLKRLGYLNHDSATYETRLETYANEIEDGPFGKIEGITIDMHGDIEIDIRLLVTSLIIDLITFLREARLEGQRKYYLSAHDRILRYIDKLQAIKKETEGKNVNDKELLKRLDKVVDELPTDVKIKYMERMRQLEESGGLPPPFPTTTDGKTAKDTNNAKNNAKTKKVKQKQ